MVEDPARRLAVDDVDLAGGRSCREDPEVARVDRVGVVSGRAVTEGDLDPLLEGELRAVGDGSFSSVGGSLSVPAPDPWMAGLR